MVFNSLCLISMFFSCYNNNKKECSIFIKEKFGYKTELQICSCDNDTIIPSLQISALIDSILSFSTEDQFSIDDSILVNLIDTSNNEIDGKTYVFKKYKYWINGYIIYGINVEGIGTIYLSNDNDNSLRLTQKIYIKDYDTLFYSYRSLQMQVDSFLLPPKQPQINEIAIDSILILN